MDPIDVELEEVPGLDRLASLKDRPALLKVRTLLHDGAGPVAISPEEKFAEPSLFLFSYDNWVRQMCLFLTENNRAFKMLINFALVV